jgi:hypothetical protein
MPSAAFAGTATVQVAKRFIATRGPAFFIVPSAYLTASEHACAPPAGRWKTAFEP